MRPMRVHLGSDHAGLDLKDHLLGWLADHGYEVVDHGPFVYDAVDDYPVFCLRAAEGVAAERAEGLDSLGVVIGGSASSRRTRRRASSRRCPSRPSAVPRDAMPEGHTLHRLAGDLTTAFGGRVVRAGSPQGRFADSAALVDGSVLEQAEAWGKHLF